jgi:hypothetical protein
VTDDTSVTRSVGWSAGLHPVARGDTGSATGANSKTPASRRALPGGRTNPDGDNATDPLSEARAAAQDLHATLSDAASRRGGVAKAELEAVQAKTRTLIDSLKTSVSTQEKAARKHMNEAMVNLESARKHAVEGAKSFGTHSTPGHLFR